MTKATKNPMAQIVETVKTTSQGATVKTVSTSPSLTEVQVLDLITDSAVACASGEKAKAEQEQALKSFNDKAQALHNGGVRLLDGRKKDPSSMANRKAFLDQAEKSGLAPKTAQNYYELFFKVVNSGKAIKSFDFKTNAKKSGNGKTEGAIIDILAKLYNHSGFEATLSDEAQKEITDLLIEAKYI